MVQFILLLVSAFLFSNASVSEAQQVPPNTFQDLHWRMIGPFRGGRTRALAGVASQPNVFYIGVGDGGVWKSDDYGRTWTPIFDAQPTQSIGAIAVAPSDPNIVYVASGEGLHRPDLSVGDGIYKSTDGGKAWAHLGLRDSQQIPALVIDPRDPNRLFAAVLGHPYGASEERGIFRSTDGGQTWTKVLYKDASTGASDVEMDPSNPNVLYASLWQSTLGPWEDKNSYSGTSGGLFKSTDGGDTWHPVMNGLPKNVTQNYVAIAPSQPNRLYCIVGTTEPGGYASGKGLGFYRSDDGGEHWSVGTDDPRPVMRIGGGDLPIPNVDPKNPDIVYSVSIVTVRSTDGGKTWTSIRGAPGGDDYQNIWINPNDPRIVFLVSDQGAIITVNGGQSWSSWYNQPTAQLYHVGVSNSFPYLVCSGQQESGSVCISSRGNDGEITDREWHPVGIIEYGYAAPDPLDPNIIYGGGRSEVTRFHWDTGQVQDVTPIPVKGDQIRADRTQPTMFSPLDPHTLYYTTNFLFKTTDGGEHWETISPDLARPHPGIPASLGNLADNDPQADKPRGVIYSLAPSFQSINTLWAGTDDGLIWVTRDGGKNWKDITPPELTAWSKVTQMDASRFDDDTVYASVSRFRIDDLHPYIYRTHDGGKSWQKIITGLPDNEPVNTVREDPERKGLLFAGTERSVYVSFDDGDHWQSLRLNLPATSIRDLVVHQDDVVVGTHGRSFWILDNITPLRQLNADFAESQAHLFAPQLTYRVRRDNNPDTPLPPEVPAGQNPPDGAMLDYVLKSAADPLTLEIFDGAGKLVRRFSSTDKLEPVDPEKLNIPTYWIRPPRILSSEAGMHRFVWDLHYPPPDSLEHEYPISAIYHDTPRYPLGAGALPGNYTVKLTVNGSSDVQPLVIRMDPRVKAPPEDLRRQFDLETKIVEAMRRDYQAIEQVRGLREQLKKMQGKDQAPSAELAALAQQAQELEGGEMGYGARFLSTPEGRSLTALNAALGQLLATVDSADAAPTTQAVSMFAEVGAALNQQLQRWENIKSKDVPALNIKLQQTRLRALDPEQRAAEEEKWGEPARAAGEEEP